MKRISTIYTIVAVAAALVVAGSYFTSCDKVLQDFVVTFDSNGGSNIATQIVTKGDNVIEPSSAPSKAGNEFVGWFSYDNVPDKWDFATQVVTSDITLYAKWASTAIEDSDGMKTAPLMDRDDYAIFEKTVILFEDDNYLITTPLLFFLIDINDFLLQTSTKGSSDLSSFIEQIIADGEKKNPLYASSYFKEQITFNRVLSIFMVNGQCFVYDRKNQDSIKQVAYDQYEVNTSDGIFFDHHGGTRFYFINNILFLETVDWSII